MMMLLCLACGSDNGGDEPTPAPPSTPDPGVKQPSQLDIYVYTPERPVVTRADEVMVEPEEEEKAIHNLDIWVFVAEDKTVSDESMTKGELVGHISPQVGADFEGGKYQMTVSERFSTVVPKVDVYVAANVRAGNTGISLTAESAPAILTDAQITGRSFGLSSPMVTTVPREGLPMSGVLKAASITGSAPVLSVAESVKLVRTVSKVRFLFCRTEVQNLRIFDIRFDDDIIPDAEYLFLSEPWSNGKYRVGTVYAASASLSPLQDAINIPVCEYPAKFAYTGELTGDDYEALINSGVAGGELGQVGRFYLRETDKRVTGTIRYRIDDGADKTAIFQMGGAGGFTRNHTWIVYGYFAGKEGLEISTVTVNPWDDQQSEHPVYNW